MRAACLCLTALLVAPHADAAPTPDRSKQELEALKKRLPGILTDWVKERQNGELTWLTTPSTDMDVTCKPELRVLRRVSPNRAKATILFVAYGNKERFPVKDVFLTVYLTYQDGCWTTERFEASSLEEDSKKLRRYFVSLVMAIDEAAKK